MRLSEIKDNAKKGDLLMMELTPFNPYDESHSPLLTFCSFGPEVMEGGSIGRRNISVVLAEYNSLQLHNPTWNNVYEEGKRDKRDFGLMQYLSNPIEIRRENNRTTHKKAPSFLNVDRFEIGVDSIINRLDELHLVLYSEVIEMGGLITSQNAHEAPREWYFAKRKQPLLFNKKILRSNPI